MTQIDYTQKESEISIENLLKIGFEEYKSEITSNFNHIFKIKKNLHLVFDYGDFYLNSLEDSNSLHFENINEIKDFLLKFQRPEGTPRSKFLANIRKAGFNPVGITIMVCEETFIFKTKKEVSEAWELFKNEGWWYALEDGEWDKTLEEYKINHNPNIKVHRFD